MKTKLLALALLAGGSAFAETHFSIGINLGGPGYYAPAPVVAVRPPYPGPGYTWTDGYWAPTGAWVTGYWAPPVYGGWVAPRYYGGGYREGYRERDCGWDRGREQGHGRRR